MNLQKLIFNSYQDSTYLHSRVDSSVAEHLVTIMDVLGGIGIASGIRPSVSSFAIPSHLGQSKSIDTSVVSLFFLMPNGYMQQIFGLTLWMMQLFSLKNRQVLPLIGRVKFSWM